MLGTETQVDRNAVFPLFLLSLPLPLPLQWHCTKNGRCMLVCSSTTLAFSSLLSFFLFFFPSSLLSPSFRDAVNDMALHFLSKMKILVVRDIEREDIEFISKVSKEYSTFLHVTDYKVLFCCYGYRR